jgi:hypothetical protein
MMGAKKLMVIVSILVAIGMHSSCSQENAGPMYSPQTFSYKVESVTYSGGLVDAGYTDSTKTFHLELYSNPVYENYLFIDMAGSPYLAPGIYPLGYDSATNVTLQMVLYKDGSHPFAATTGNLTITSFDSTNRKMAGEFHFTGKLYNDVLHITAGSFDLGYRLK